MPNNINELQQNRRLRELIDAGDPQSGNRFRFRFVFVSCVRASGRGEAVWACERGVFVNAGGLHSNISSSGRGFGPSVFNAMRMGFKNFLARIAAMCMVFLIFLRFRCYTHGFFDCSSCLDTVSCYMHGFFGCVAQCAAICMVFL